MWGAFSLELADMARKSNVETLEPSAYPERDSPEWRALLDRTNAANGPEDDPEEFEGDEGETSQDRVQRMLQTISGGARATVKLYRNVSGRKQWCKDYSPNEFEHSGMTQIREDWGAGEYEIVLYGERMLSSGKPHYGVRGRVTIEIAAPNRNPNQAALPAPAIAPELVQVLQSLAQGQQAIVQALSARPAPVDPAEQMRQTFEMIKLAREAAAPVSPAAAPSNAMAEMMQAFRLMKEMSAEINPPAAPDDPLMAALPMVTQLLARGNQPAPQPAEPFPSVALPPIMSNPAPEQQPATDESQTVSIAILRAQVNMLVDMAAKGSADFKPGEANHAYTQSIEEGAQLVYDKAPDEVIDLIGSPGWLEQLGLFVPAVLNHRKWFEAVGARVLGMLESDARESEQPSA